LSPGSLEEGVTVPVLILEIRPNESAVPVWSEMEFDDPILENRW
jgi:hypothetical protein